MSSSASAAPASTSVLNSRPIVAATPTKPRAGALSWASRASITDWMRGLIEPPLAQPARSASTTNSGLPSVSS